jgi:hypothetical protein
MLASFNSCLCDLLSEFRVAFQGGYVKAGAINSKAGIEQVIDQIASRTIQLEVLQRKCISEARRHRALGAKLPFRNKMLELRRIQNQITQLQRYRESALAHLDAVSNHEINQTFIKAIQNAGGSMSTMPLKEAETAIENLQESVSHAQQMSDLLGQPVGEDITDDDLELEFMEFSSNETITEPPDQQITVTLPDIPAPPLLIDKPAPTELRLTGLFAH